jgi:photosystem II stability/assembly factor-like uncharacterized protein
VSVADTSYYLSANGGASFARPAAPTSQADIMAFDPTDASGMRVIGLSQMGTQVLESLDAGTSWRAIGNLPADTLNNGDPPGRRASGRATSPISYQDSRVTYLSGSHGSVYRAADGGAIWDKVLSGTALNQ